MMDATELGCGPGSEGVHDGIGNGAAQPLSGQMEESEGDATAIQEHDMASTMTDAVQAEGSTKEPSEDSANNGELIVDNSAADLVEKVDGNQAMPDIEHVSREALTSLEEAGDASPNEELKRLRSLVFASRGTKSQLPQGWEDEGDGQGSGEGASKSTPAPKADDMVDRAVASVGEQIAESEEESSEESSSESSSSSSDSESEAETNRKPTAGIVNYASDEEDDEEGGKGGTSGRGPTTKNEVVEATVDVPPYSIVPPDKDIRPLGKVHSIVDSVVVVSQETGKAPGVESFSYAQPVDSQGRRGEQAGEYSVLDTGSLLTFDDRKVLGVVYETFGSVLEPLYALRFQSAEHVNANVIFVGKPVFYVPADSTYVLTRALRAMGKGSDASNVWDEEVGDEERDFSDDEAEAEYKRNLKASKRQDGGAPPASGPSTTGRGSGGGARRGGVPRPQAMAGQWQHQQQQHSPYAPAQIAPPVTASVMHPDVDLGIARSAPLPYDDDSANAGLGGAGVRYAPYQHVRPRGAHTPAGGMARGRGRGHFGQAMTNYGGHATAAVNPVFVAAGGQNGVYGQVNPYAAYAQQQAYGATPGTPNTFNYYPYGNSSGGYAMMQQQQQPFNYAVNAPTSTYEGGQTIPNTNQGPEQKNQTDGVYDPCQPHY